MQGRTHDVAVNLPEEIKQKRKDSADALTLSPITTNATPTVISSTVTPLSATATTVTEISRSTTSPTSSNVCQRPRVGEKRKHLVHFFGDSEFSPSPSKVLGKDSQTRPTSLLAATVGESSASSTSLSSNSSSPTRDDHSQSVANMVDDCRWPDDSQVVVPSPPHVELDLNKVFDEPPVHIAPTSSRQRRVAHARTEKIHASRSNLFQASRKPSVMTDTQQQLASAGSRSPTTAHQLGTINKLRDRIVSTLIKK